MSAAQGVTASARVDAAGASLASAEAAYARGDAAAAERGYAAVLAENPHEPRALFRLAQLRSHDAKASAALLQEYIRVVPDDAWGHLALAHAFARRGDADRALRAYTGAAERAPGDHDIQLGRPRLLERLGRIDAAIGAFEAWLTNNPDEHDVWRELAAVLQRAGRLQSARRALERARGPNPGDAAVERRIEMLRIRNAPAVHVGVFAAGETDVFTVAPSFGAELAAGDTGRLGVTYDQKRVSSLGEVAHLQRVVVHASARPRSDIRLNVAGGAAWNAPEPGYASRFRPDAAFRLRRAGSSDGSVLDIRAQRDSIDVTPALVRAPVSRTQLMTAIDVPVGGPLRARGRARAAALERSGEHNRRLDGAGGLAVAITPALRLSGQWHQRWHSNPAVTGYFAPALAQVADLGLEFEREYDRASVALDVGGGLQRFKRTDQAALGSWSPALRLWGHTSWTMTRRTQLLVELETYDSQLSDSVVVTERWRYASIAASLRVSVR